MLKKEEIRKLVIGDIHGNMKGLEQCLERAGYDKEYDMLIFLGDYVDGWSESAQVIDFLITLESQAIHKPIFIKGNHDVWCYEWLWFNQAPNIWLNQGGKSTIESYIDMGLVSDEKHKQFFKKLVNFYIDEENRGFVHGGFRSNKGLGHESHETMYYWDRDLWKLAMVRNNNVKIQEQSSNHKEVYIGHTATELYNIKPYYKEYFDPNQPKNGKILVPMNRNNIWNIDTGSGWSGKLTIMDIDSKEYWQSDLSRDLYPKEKERFGG